MATYLTNEKKSEIFQKYGGSAENTGSTEGQVALVTFRIQEMSKHLNENPKDHSCRKALLHLVGRRKRLLNYLMKKDLDGYRNLIQDLGLRK